MAGDPRRAYPDRAGKPETTYLAHDEDAPRAQGARRSSGRTTALPAHDVSERFDEGDDGAPDELLLGRYIPEQEAGVGGFSHVIVAWDTRIQRRVAIKCMPLDEAPAGFAAQGGSILVDDAPDTDGVPGLEEARTAAMLSDSAIVQVYDFEVQDRMAYLILGYVDGMTLGDLLDFFGDEVDADVVAAVFKAVAHALQVAHAHQVLHLDIKPENVLINREGKVKVTDFGLARLAGEAGYGSASGGTIGYMPPEQMLQDDLDERCDEWALASLTYEMISGGNPFIADTLAAAEDAIYDTELVIPSLCMEGLDESIDDIMFCALSPDREGRYDTVKEFAEQLQPCLGGPRRGANKLKRLVGDAADEGTGELSFDEAADDGRDERAPRVRTGLSPRARGALMRLWAAASAAALGFVTVSAIAEPDTWSKPLAWGVLAALVALSAVVPRVGALVSAEAFGVALCVCGAPVPGAVMIMAAGGWWFVSGRASAASSNAALVPSLAGMVGLGPLAPLVAGWTLSVRDACVTSAFSAVLAMLLAGFGSLTLTSWDVVAYAKGGLSPALVDSLLVVAQSPSTWIVAAGWVAAAAALSALVSLGRRAWAVVGMVVAAVLLIGTIVLGSWVDTVGATFVERPFDLVSVVVVSIAGIAFATNADLPRRP